LVNVHDRVSNKSVLDQHAWKPSEIKKIFPWDNCCPLPDFFESILEDEFWIKFKIDQIAAQFVACGLNHETPILVNYFCDRLHAAQYGS